MLLTQQPERLGSCGTHSQSLVCTAHIGFSRGRYSSAGPERQLDRCMVDLRDQWSVVIVGVVLAWRRHLACEAISPQRRTAQNLAHQDPLLEPGIEAKMLPAVDEPRVQDQVGSGTVTNRWVFERTGPPRIDFCISAESRDLERVAVKDASGPRTSSGVTLLSIVGGIADHSRVDG